MCFVPGRDLLMGNTIKAQQLQRSGIDDSQCSTSAIYTLSFSPFSNIVHDPLLFSAAPVKILTRIRSLNLVRPPGTMHHHQSFRAKLAMLYSNRCH